MSWWTTCAIAENESPDGATAAMTGPSGDGGWKAGASRGKDRLTLPDLASNDALSLELAGRPQRSVGGPVAAGARHIL